MMNRFNPIPIIKDQLCKRGNKPSPLSIFVFVAFPVLVASTAVWFLGGVSSPETVGVLLAIISLMASVMTASMAMIYTVLSSTRVGDHLARSPYLKGKPSEASTRVSLLRELYTDTAFSTLVLIASLAPTGLLLIDWNVLEARVISAWIPFALNTLVFASLICAVLSLLSIVTGLYLVIDYDGGVLQRKVEDAVDPDPVPPSQPTSGHTTEHRDYLLSPSA